MCLSNKKPQTIKSHQKKKWEDVTKKRLKNLRKLKKDTVKLQQGINATL